MSKVDFALLNAWADKLLPIAEEAGRATLDVRKRGFEIMAKNDDSPVTEADQIAEGIITTVLEKLDPVIPIVAEERVAKDAPPNFEGNSFWLVDALDGTKEFIKGGDDYTVNIALVWNGVPTLGLVHAPARGDTYIGVVDPNGTQRRAEVVRGGKSTKIAVRPRGPKVIITGSKSHEVPELMNPFLAQYDVEEKIVIGSSLKLCLIAEGKADLYPRFGPTCEWDIGAGHAVVRAAGGRVHCFDGTEMPYKKPNFLNGRFLAEGPAGSAA
jgi:3'(2'), 5'-bisphosphate nucleotidase